MSMIWHPAKSSSRLSAPLWNLNETASLSHENSFDSEGTASFTPSSSGRCGPSHDAEKAIAPSITPTSSSRSLSTSRQQLPSTGEVGPSTSGLLQDSTEPAAGTERRMPTCSSKSNTRRPSYGEVRPTPPLVEGLITPSASLSINDEHIRTPTDIRNELMPIYYDSDDSSNVTSYEDTPPRNMRFQGSELSMQHRGMTSSSMRGEPTLGEDLPGDE